MADCFISYRRTPSSAVATAIQAKLEAQHKLDAYLDTTRTDSTKVRFPERLMQAISDAPVFVCVLGERDGEHTLESEWVLKEIQQAYDLRKFCIPVFQESYRPLPDMPPAVDYVLGFDGVHILDQKNIMVDESVRQIAELIRPHVRTRRFPWVAAVGVVAVLLIAALFLFTQLNSPEVELTPDRGATAEVAQDATQPENTVAVEATTEEPTQTPSETQTPSPTDTPTVTPTFTPTPNATQIEATITAEMGMIAQEERATQEAAEEATNDAIRQAEVGTAQALTQTATLWTSTPTPDLRATAEARSTATAEQQATEAQETVDAQNTATQQVVDATATATLWTATPSATPTPTASNTPSNTPTPSPTNTPDPIQLAFTPVARNADWTPVEREFDGVTMVLVPAGSFEMGSTAEEIDFGFEMCQQAADNDAECQRVWVEDEAQNGDNTQIFSQPFWIDKYEVTRAEYQRCVEAGACTETPSSAYSTDDDQPINRVTWYQAQDYCEWRGAQLPTEAQWEYAARGPDRLIFPWGNEFDGTLANHCDRNCGNSDWGSSFNYVNEENDDGFAITSPVGSFPAGASWVGALDMSGNVWEWTSTIYDDFAYPYDATDGRENADSDARRVVRGGSFDDASSALRVAGRFGNLVGFDDFIVGFRCALWRPPSP